MNINIKSTLIFILLLCGRFTTHAQYRMEYLDRGLIAIPSDSGRVFISWRLLGDEPHQTGFHLYRTIRGRKQRLTRTPLTGATCFTDASADTASDITYSVTVIGSNGKESNGHDYLLKAGSPRHLRIPLQSPVGYAPNDASVGDMDGDGRYELVVHMTGKGADNSRPGFTDPPVFQCYTLDGRMLWQINLGRNIREGAHYTQFMVYDLDGDGRAEVAMKTADGTIDGIGKVIGDSTKNHRDARGYILKGPEYLTIFDGLTGAARATVPYVPARHPETENPTTEQLKEVWGDGYGNRVDRFLACVAYLDGQRPSLVMCRGYYTRTVLAAWDFRDGKLQQRWVFDTRENGLKAFAGQGNHNLTVTDVDADGRQEIIYGQMTVDDNGKGLYTTGIGHADALHVSDLDPSRPGLEVFGTQEKFGDAGANFRDARTGEVIWKKPSIAAGPDGEGPGRALSIDIDPRYPGHESWVAGAGIRGIFDVKGNMITDRSPACNMAIWWDGDPLREILNGVNIEKWEYETSSTRRLFDGAMAGVRSNNSTKANPCLNADILGDWREEIIARTIDNSALLIFSTDIPTDIRLPTLMHDPQYRMSIAWQNVAYNQPPHTSFFIGHGMKTPPMPPIRIIRK
jgi:rhamnogalacturonan endolyase